MDLKPQRDADAVAVAVAVPVVCHPAAVRLFRFPRTCIAVCARDMRACVRAYVRAMARLVQLMLLAMCAVCLVPLFLLMLTHEWVGWLVGIVTGWDPIRHGRRRLKYVHKNRQSNTSAVIFDS